MTPKQRLRLFVWASHIAWLAGVYMLFGPGWALLNLGFNLFLSVWIASYLETKKRTANDKQS